MKKIYNRIEKEFYSLEECQDFIFEIRKATGDMILWESVSSLTLEECCEILNQEDVFNFGTTYYIVDENITHEELLKVIYS